MLGGDESLNLPTARWLCQWLGPGTYQSSSSDLRPFQYNTPNTTGAQLHGKLRRDYSSLLSNTAGLMKVQLLAIKKTRAIWFRQFLTCVFLGDIVESNLQQ